ncbi:GEVED domain-containing protein [Brumimicrobium aurantiacum]|uniref:T9SS C-terminal target domain-containing protein n=1 Tax=Brumimicrobium aurantiacum TaxID=1737063 RepID=A0A3E1EX02_9FLAO|nr:GEVED domain-containing protein [Brumimicrobium aurantiacum]RFC54077.1 T9SS C-terminal target domain-containing protein [Brumimicrobium aurantiacum]
MNNFYKKVKGIGLSLLAVASFANVSNAQCPPEVAPYLEEFSGGSLPSCYTNTTSGGTSANELWKFTGAPGYGATSNGRSNGTYAWVDGSTPNPSSTDLTTVMVDLSPLTTPALSFDWFSNNTNNPGDNMPLKVEVNDGTTWTTITTLSGDDPAWQEEILDLSAFTGATVQVRFSIDQTVPGTAFYNDILLDDVRLFEAPTCFKPDNLLAANISNTSAELSWTDPNGSTTWNVEWGAPGFAVGTGAHIGQVTGTNSNPLNITITPQTNYEFYVQSDCGGGDLSEWKGPYAFNNIYCTFTTTSSSQWINSFQTTGGIIDINNQNSGPGTTSPSYSDFTTTMLDAYETQTIDFDMVASNTSTIWGVSIFVDFNNNFNFESSEEVFNSGGYMALPGSGSFFIPAGTPVGQYRMRVVAAYINSSPDPCSASNGEAEDYTLNIINPPSCLPPIDVDTVSVSTSSVELEWNELNGATNWVIEYGLSGFAQGTGAGQQISVNTNPAVVSGLNPSAEYDFYVLTDCGSGDSSAWRGPFTQYTDCGVAVAPFYEGFNNGIQPQCWENLSSLNSTSTNNFWKFSGVQGYGAANNGRTPGNFAWADGSSVTPDSMMLISPEIDLSQLTNPYLSFEWFSNNTNNPGDNVPLIIEVFDGTNWNLIDTLRGDDPEWLFTNYDLSSFIGNIIQVRFMVNQTATNSLAQYNDILIDEVRIDDCIDLGGIDGDLDVCRLDSTVNLNGGLITKPNGGGIWSFPNQPVFLTQDSVFNVLSIPVGSYDVYYVERNVCYDTTIATINVFNPSSAGNDGVAEVCQNEPISLYSALSGGVDLGGEWYDYQGLLVGSQVIAANIPGAYNYEYIADNGVCPADTSIVEVTVRQDCDWLLIEGEEFTDISVYPNPASSVLNIVNPSNTSELKIEMLDMNGRVVMVEDKALNNASEAAITINHLENGVYTLRVYNKEGHKTFKVVKQ